MNLQQVTELVNDVVAKFGSVTHVLTSPTFLIRLLQGVADIALGAPDDETARAEAGALLLRLEREFGSGA